MRKLTFDRLGFQADDIDAFLISGEFHYFRVPMEDWKRRMEQFKAAGGNSIATYVPWCFHEPEEGNIVFDDLPQRSLTKFLETAREVGLMVTLRPGPYQYSELVGAGIPGWLLENYPELLAKNQSGESFWDCAVSYLHPLFLEKARRYYKAFAEVVRPFVSDPVVMLQTDNELTGIHVWFGSIDYNRETYGFGREDGRYAQFLRRKYGSIEAVNAAYHTQYQAFSDIYPYGENICPLQSKDYYDCYYDSMADYMCILAGWLKEDGLDLPICHNSANPSMNSVFLETVAKMPKPFLLGSDHYYNLHQGWPQNNPTPQYALRCLYSCEMLKLLGMPPTVLELPGGSPSDTPPILPEDLLACYFTNLAMGMKGMNYYVFTGGPNFGDSGETCDIYDYNAFVRADGSINPTYQSLKTFNAFCNEHSWMQRAKRQVSANIGFEWLSTRKDNDDFGGGTVGSFRFAVDGVMYAMMCSAYAPGLTELSGEMDIKKPLILPCGGEMSRNAQERVTAFIQMGGNVLICGDIPQYDLDGNPCTVLQDALKLSFDRPKKSSSVQFEEIGKVFGLALQAQFNALPEGSVVLAKEPKSGKPVCVEFGIGAGKMILFGASWKMTTFDQAKMMEYLLDRLGAKRCVASSNRNIFTSRIADEKGNSALFVMNLYSAPQQTAVTVYDASGNAVFEQEIVLKAMEVRHF